MKKENAVWYSNIMKRHSYTKNLFVRILLVNTHFCLYYTQILRNKLDIVVKLCFGYGACLIFLHVTADFSICSFHFRKIIFSAVFQKTSYFILILYFPDRN